MADKSEAPVQIKIARSEEERRRVYAFRYAVYVEEMGKRLTAADDEARTVRDELDDTGTIFYAERDGRILATLRTNFGADFPKGEPLPEELRSHYALDRFEEFPPLSFSFSSRLMVSRDLRGTVLLGQLLLHAYGVARARGVLFDFCHCAPGLIGLYEHLGYRRYTDNFLDPDTGYRVPLLLLLRDEERMREIRSPFYRALPPASESEVRTTEPEEIGWFAENFPASWEIGEWSLSEEDFWRFLHSKLHPHQSLMFHGLTDDEVRALLMGGTVLRCKKGDQLIREGDPDKELYFVLSGLFEVRLPGETVALGVFGPGQTLGEVAMLVGCRRSAHAVAVDESEALVISQTFIEKLKVQSPLLAAKVLHNLSRVLGERLVFTTRRRLPPNRPSAALRILPASQAPRVPPAAPAAPPTAAASFGSYDFAHLGDRGAELARLERQAAVAWAVEERALRGAGLAPGMKVLDLACGPGFISRRIAALVGPGGAVTGVDLSDELLAAGRELPTPPGAAPLRFLRGDACALGLPDGSLDFVYARFLFQHLPDPRRALAEIARVLRPGGRACIVDVDDAVLNLWPETPAFRRLVELAGAGQASRGGDRRVGGKLPYYLRQARFSPVQTQVQVLTSDDLGLPAFLEITSGFKAESAREEHRAEAARCVAELRALLSPAAAAPNAAPGAPTNAAPFGLVGVFIVSGVRA